MKAILNTSKQSPIVPTTEATASTSAARPSGKSRRDFASMDPARQRRLGAEGGRAATISGRGHQWTTAEAQDAGRKGGLSRRKPSQQSAS